MMSATQPLVNLLGFDRATLEDFFVAQGEKRFRGTQLIQWIHQRGCTDFSLMSNISKVLRVQLAERMEVRPPLVQREYRSEDGVRKWLFQLADGNAIETVFIPEEDRGTLCISSQVGCPMACSFCATAKAGFSRNLTTEEIIGQMWFAERQISEEHQVVRPITNIVFMGMGEPLLNLSRVLTAVRLFLDDFAYGLSRRRVTISTVGIVPAIYRLTERCEVSLAISLHAPRNSLRDQLAPINRHYPLESLIAACQRYVACQPRSRITFEYTLIDQVNDREKDAIELAKLLAKIPAKINLIPFNPFPGTSYQRPRDKEIGRFQTILMEFGYTTIIRRTRGDPIAAACGQLAGEIKPKKTLLKTDTL